jgi:hypothetical protein
MVQAKSWVRIDIYLYYRYLSVLKVPVLTIDYQLTSRQNSFLGNSSVHLCVLMTHLRIFTFPFPFSLIPSPTFGILLNLKIEICGSRAP